MAKKEEPDAPRKRKIGEGHLDAVLRQGIRELREAVNPSKDAPTVDEIGLYGTATQGEIASARDHKEEEHSRGRE